MGTEKLIEQGQVLGGRYRLEEALATDPLVHVWRAEDIELHRPVVCKLLHPRLMDHGPTVERFRFGAFAATRLDHENIARTYDVEETDGSLYTVSEHVDGPDVGELIASGELTAETVAAVGQQAAAALGAAHDLGLAHGGVCPQNLMVGAGGRLRLIDFGSVQYADLPDVQPADPSDWEPQVRDYWAPERRAGGEVDTAGDLYALGLVLWEALTGEAAIGSPEPDEQPGILRRLVDELRRGHADVEAGLREVLTAATADDPAKRPTAHALVDHLDALVGVRPHELLASWLDGGDPPTTGAGPP